MRRGHRELDQLTATGGRDAAGTHGCIGYAIDIVPNRKDAGVIGEAQLAQDIQSPQRLPRDGISRGPIAVDAYAGDVFQQGFGVAGLGIKLIARLVEHQLVTHAVTGDLVTGSQDVAHQLRAALGHPTQHKERGFDFALFEQLQQAVRVGLGAIGHGVPLLAPYNLRKRDDVEVVFDVNGQRIDHLAPSPLYRNLSQTRFSLTPELKACKGCAAPCDCEC